MAKLEFKNYWSSAVLQNLKWFNFLPFKLYLLLKIMDATKQHNQKEKGQMISNHAIWQQDHRWLTRVNFTERYTYVRSLEYVCAVHWHVDIIYVYVNVARTHVIAGLQASLWFKKWKFETSNYVFFSIWKHFFEFYSSENESIVHKIVTVLREHCEFEPFFLNCLEIGIFLRLIRSHRMPFACSEMACSET